MTLSKNENDKKKLNKQVNKQKYKGKQCLLNTVSFVSHKSRLNS